MEHFGMWGIIPPLLAIVLAFITKDVIISLFLGILAGTLIVAGGNPISAMMNTTDILAGSLADGWNIRIFLFCALLGALVGMMSKAGAAGSFGRWASKKLKSGTGSQFMTFVFGVIIFIDDYFNSLTVGTVMRPINDQNKVSRAKLAYILDSTAAPICILAPISSWVVTVMSIIRGAEGFELMGMTDLEFFIRSIPYNLYAITALFMVLAVIFLKRDFGPMLKSEMYTQSTGNPTNISIYGEPSGNVEEDINDRAKPIDMLFPIILLIIACVTFFPVVTWIGAIDGESITSLSQAMASMTFADAFNNTDASYALFYAIIFTIVITYVYYLCRKLLTLTTASESLRNGMKSMLPALIILTMAWSIGSIIKSSPADGGLGLGTYLSQVVIESGFPFWIIPAIIFILSAVIAFATGTSWGTFGIMIPIVLPIATGIAVGQNFAASELINVAFISVSAVLGGAVFGDHASPISDTTILSSTGASCPHIEHVTTQLPYALFVAICCFVGFIAAGIFMNIVIAWAVVLVLFVAGLIFLPKYWRPKADN